MTASTLPADPQDAAAQAGLVHVNDAAPGITRRRAGKGWSYRHPDGKPVDAKTRRRIDALAIPPAYTDVWICPDPRGHIQATGRDARGRKQYRYHTGFRAVRDSSKYAHMLEFASALPAIRATVTRHMALAGLPRDKILATLVRLLETTMIRVGNDDYARTNKSYGLTTLRNRHVDITGSALRFRFRGKSGKDWNLKISDRRIARIVRASQELPGQQLFQYVDDDGAINAIGSGDLNAYLREISGQNITAKDFRTWAGTVLAARALVEIAETGGGGSAADIRAAVASVAARLGNTPTVCRTCYIHPGILEAATNGELVLAAVKRADPAFEPDEAMVLAFLTSRDRSKKC